MTSTEVVSVQGLGFNRYHGSESVLIASPSYPRNTEMRYRSTAGDEVEDMEVLLREVQRQLPGRRPMFATMMSS